VTCISELALRNPDGTIAVEQRQDGADNREGLTVLQCGELGLQIAVIDGEGFFAFTGGVLGERLGAYDSDARGPISNLMAIGDGRFLADAHYNPNAPATLRQYDLARLDEPVELTREPYFFFVRPPKLLDVGGGARALIYYWESANYAFGGDSSRPMYSGVRVYTPEQPDGADVLHTTFRFGVITDLRRDGDEWVVVVDPTSPRDEQPRDRATLRLSGPLVDR
jgi:hypothetical protein